MKNINKIGGLLLASVLATGCYNEPLSDYSSLRDFAYACGTTNNNNSPIVMQQNEQMSFLNLTQGALSSTWTIPEGEGIYFLGDELLYFKEDDPETTVDETTKVDYESMIIDHPYSFSDNKKAVHLYFTEPGNYSVNLRCTFDRPVTYTLFSTVLEKEITYSSVYENGVHVIDKDIDLFVISDAIVPVLTVKYGDSEFVYDMNSFDPETDPADYDSITIKYGESVSFSDAFEAVDMIDVRSWSCGNPTLSSTAAAPNFALRPNALIEPGVDTCIVYYEGTRWAVGSYIENELTSGNIRIPLNIFVENNETELSASAAYYANTNADYLNKNLRLTLSNGQFDAESLLNAKAEDFVVSYTNEAAGVIEPKTIPVDTVYYVNANSKHILNVMLEEQIYTSDIATISYVGSDINVLFNGTASSFSVTDLAISMNAPEAGEFDYNFEDVDNVDNWKIIIPEDLSVYQPWPGTHSVPTLEEEDGNHYLSVEPDKQTYAEYSIYLVNTNTFAGKMGNNVMTGKIRVSESAKTDLNVYFPTDITKTTTINNTGFAGSQYIRLSDTEKFVNGEWCDFEITFTKASNITGYLNLELGKSQRGKVDFDDLYLTNLEARPTVE